MAQTILRKLRFRLALWQAARILPLRIHKQPLSEILNMLRSRRANPYQGLPVDFIVNSIRRTVRRPLVMRDRRCLREGLLAFRFLDAAGFQPELHFGIDRTTLLGSGLLAHCWVVCDGKVVLNAPNPDMVSILVWPEARSAAKLPNGLAHATFD